MFAVYPPTSLDPTILNEYKDIRFFFICESVNIEKQCNLIMGRVDVGNSHAHEWNSSEKVESLVDYGLYESIEKFIYNLYLLKYQTLYPVGKS